jgi:hypothetical protein
VFNKSPYIGLRLATLLLIFLMTQSWAGHIVAQDSTSRALATKALPFNKTLSGQLRGKGEKVTYVFDIPVDQDIVIEYRANKLVFSGHCILTGTSQPDDDHCVNYGGSGGDRPITSFSLIPTSGQKGQHATVTLVRVLDGASTYQITAYTITPQVIKLGEDVNSSIVDSESYQTYTLDVEPKLSFAVEIEDDTTDGNFLWAAYQPFTSKTFPVFSEQLLPLPQWVDGASGPNGAPGINLLQLYYLGGRTFRVLARSSKSYKLYSSNIGLPLLDENHPINLTVNYRQPLLVTQLNIQPGETAQVNFNVTVGKGAIGQVYEEGSLFDKGLSLGWTGNDGPTFELANNVQRTAMKALYVVVQIPFDYTRDKVNIEVMWQRVN